MKKMLLLDIKVVQCHSIAVWIQFLFSLQLWYCHAPVDKVQLKYVTWYWPVVLVLFLCQISSMVAIKHDFVAAFWAVMAPWLIGASWHPGWLGRPLNGPWWDHYSHLYGHTDPTSRTSYSVCTTSRRPWDLIVIYHNILTFPNKWMGKCKKDVTPVR